MLETAKSKRILAIDILRGATICGMILVNNPGSWGSIYAPLSHAEWNGLTPTDLIFPFFMFIMGVSMYISLRKYQFQATDATFQKIIKRTIGIYFVGIFIGWFAHFCYFWAGDNRTPDFVDDFLHAIWNFPTMRFSGVLARLAICYGICSVLVIVLKHKYIPYIIAALLLVYTVILFLGNGFCYGAENILSQVDTAILGDNHMYHDNHIDPEGLLSTLPSLAHVLLGFWIGKHLLSDSRQNNSVAQTQYLLVFGAVLTFCGFLLSYGCPLNKKIWSPTFVLTTCGLASTLLGLLIYVIDLRGFRKWSTFFETFGVNPLFLFVVSDILAILLGSIHISWGGEVCSIHGVFYHNLLVPMFGSYGGSFVYALLFVFLNWIIGNQLYKRKIYIKL